MTKKLVTMLLILTTVMLNFSGIFVSAEAVDLTFTADADSYLNSNPRQTTQNFGDETELLIKTKITPIIRFDLTDYIWISEAENAKLKLYIIEASADTSITVSGMTENKTWKENTVNYSSIGTPVLCDTVITYLFDTDITNQWIEIDITDLVNNEDDKIISLYIASTSSVAVKFASKEYSDGLTQTSYAPALSTCGEVTENTTKVKQLSLNHTEVTIEKDETLQLSATILPETATNKNIIWTSSDNKVAKVSSDGLVTGVWEELAPNSCEIRATSEEKDSVFAVCKVNVTPIGYIDGKDYILAGKCGESVDWTLDINGLLIITGTGDMYDYTDLSEAPWNDVNSSIEKVIVNEGVTSIGNRAFYGCTKLKNITLPDSLQKIGEYGFHQAAIQEISLPENLKSIGMDAFSYCENLKSIEIPDSVETISIDAFRKCTNLESVKLPKALKHVNSGLFYQCENLKNISLPDTVEEIGSDVFGYCSSLESIIIPKSVTEIHGQVFSNCENLSSVVFLGDSLETLGESVFAYCPSLEEIKLPDGISSIPLQTFYNCTALKTVHMPDSVTTIGYNAFYDCTSLQTITLAKELSLIDSYAFRNCTNLNSIVIGNKVTKIMYDAFSNCSSLSDVYYTGTKEEWNNITIKEDNIPLLNATIHYNYVQTTYGDINGDDSINVNDAVLLVEYIGAISSGGALDETKFPDGTLPGGEACAKLTDDDVINVNDVVLLVEYIGTISSGGTLDETKFPGGTFPGAN